MIPNRGFHGTSPDNIPSILREGLRFPAPSLGDTGETIWVARDEEVAVRYGGAVFEVNFEDIEGGWFDDYGTVWQAHLFEPIPPDRLRFLFIRLVCDT